MVRVVMVCALKHHTRRGERDPERWQYASEPVNDFETVTIAIY